MCRLNTTSTTDTINFSELKFCFWNIGGLKDKLEDELFLTEIKGNDIILWQKRTLDIIRKYHLKGIFVIRSVDLFLVMVGFMGVWLC